MAGLTIFKPIFFSLAVMLVAAPPGEAREAGENARENIEADRAILRRDSRNGNDRSEMEREKSRAADRTIENSREAIPGESSPPASTMENERQPTHGEQPNTGVDRLRRPAAP